MSELGLNEIEIYVISQNIWTAGWVTLSELLFQETLSLVFIFVLLQSSPNCHAFCCQVYFFLSQFIMDFNLLYFPFTTLSTPHDWCRLVKWFKRNKTFFYSCSRLERLGCFCELQKRETSSGTHFSLPFLQ